jgi:hypothetical protein
LDFNLFESLTATKPQYAKLKTNWSHESINHIEFKDEPVIQPERKNVNTKPTKSKSVASFTKKASEKMKTRPQTVAQLNSIQPNHRTQLIGDVVNFVNYEGLKSYIEPIPLTKDELNANKFSLYRKSNNFGDAKNFL